MGLLVIPTLVGLMIFTAFFVSRKDRFVAVMILTVCLGATAGCLLALPIINATNQTTATVSPDTYYTYGDCEIGADVDSGQTFVTGTQMPLTRQLASALCGIDNVPANK